jgi:hypothetical protein
VVRVKCGAGARRGAAASRRARAASSETTATAGAVGAFLLVRAAMMASHMASRGTVTGGR